MGTTKEVGLTDVNVGKDVAESGLFGRDVVTGKEVARPPAMDETEGIDVGSEVVSYPGRVGIVSDEIEVTAP